MGARRFQDLVAWQRGHELRRSIWAIVGRTADIDMKFKAQWTDAARSVCSNIAEGFGRWSHLEFARFLDHSMSSLREIEDLVIEAEMRGYLSKTEAKELDSLVRRTAAPTARLLKYLRSRPNRPGQ